MRRQQPAVLALALLGTPLAAQVFVVDEANGAGAHFTDLPAAVAAVPDGATLRVRPGSYTPPRIVGKGLQIVGEDAASVFLSKTPAADPGVYQTAAGQTVLLKALSFGGLVPIAPRDFVVRGTRGAVVLDDVHTALSLASLHPFLIEDAAQVQLHHCTLGPYLPSTSPAPPVQVVRSSVHFAHGAITGASGMVATTPALRLEASRCVAVATVFTGGSGQAGCPFRLCGTAPGSTAVEVVGSTFLGLGTTCDGGRGADEFVSTQPPAVLCATDGGDGILADGSMLRLLGSVENGGDGGTAGSRCAPGTPGLPVRAVGGSTVIRDGAAVPAVADMTPRSVRGQTVTFDLKARPASPAALLLAYDPTLVPVDPVAPGSLLARIALSIPAVVPASGNLQLPFTVPLTWPLGETYFGQLVSADPVDGSLWVSNALSWHTSR